MSLIEVASTRWLNVTRRCIDNELANEIKFLSFLLYKSDGIHFLLGQLTSSIVLRSHFVAELMSPWGHFEFTLMFMQWDKSALAATCLDYMVCSLSLSRFDAQRASSSVLIKKIRTCLRNSIQEVEFKCEMAIEQKDSPNLWHFKVDLLTPLSSAIRSNDLPPLPLSSSDGARSLYFERQSERERDVLRLSPVSQVLPSA